jgi:argininosuccinate lyase
LDVAQLRTFSDLFGADAVQLLQPEAVMQARRSRGGTAPEAVHQQIQLATQLLGGEDIR